MNIQAAILCEFAQVRGGLLFVSSGGISRVGRPVNEPRPLPLYLAVILEVGFDELDRVHELRVTVNRDGGQERIGEVAAALQPPPGAAEVLHPGEPAVVPVVIPLQPIVIETNGQYDVRVSADGGVAEIRTIYFDPAPGAAE